MVKNNIQNDLKNNDVFNSIIGGTPKPINEIQQVKNIEIKPIKENDIKQNASDVKPKPIKKVNDPINEENYKYKDKTPNKNGKYSKDKNYTITFKIDADIEQYLKNIDKITFIDVMEGKANESKDATNYVNDLIRADLKKRLNIKENESNPNKWIDAYREYATKNNIKDK